MINDLDQFYLNQKEPNKSCLLALKRIILNFDNEIKPAWKYKMPFFYYREKMFCYLWTDKKSGHPYIGFVAGHKIFHPQLKQEKRKRMKVLSIDPNIDIPIEVITEILHQAKKINDSQ